MNVRMLLSIMAAAALFAACTHEDLITPPADEREDVEVALTLKMASINRTKAVGDEENPYTYATTEELKVSTCVAALFELDAYGRPGNLLGYKRAEGATLEPSTVNDTLAYRISGIPAKTGNVRILVIANSAIDYGAFKTYADFEAAVEKTQFTSTFDPAKLVKSGYRDLKLDKNMTGDIIVPMTQLAVRVDLLFHFQQALPGNEMRVNSITVNNIQTQTPVVLESVNPLKLEALTSAWSYTPPRPVTEGDKLTFYTYEKGLYSSDAHQDVLTVTIEIGIGGVAPSPNMPVSRRFMARINPSKLTPGCHTDGLIHGNLYEIDLVFKSTRVNPDLQYRVVDWKLDYKAFPPFGERQVTAM